MKSGNKSDKKFMEAALDLAEKGLGFTSPNPVVGAVIVKNGRIIGKGYHKKAGLPHAEVNAIDDAKGLAKDGTLYVTLEPCNHTGRTGPCTEAIIRSGIKRVVVAMKDPNPNVAGSGLDYLERHRISTLLGVCEQRAKKLNEIFLKYITTGKPFIIVKCAATLDGAIASKTGDSKWISNSDSRDYVHRLRHLVDGIIVGSGTVKKDNPSLTTRLKNFQAIDPARIILDTKLQIDENAKVLNCKSKAKTFILCSNAPARKRITLEKKGAVVIEISQKGSKLDLNKAVEILAGYGITSILVEGGSEVINSAIKIADKIIFFYAPKILGASDGVPICRGIGPDFIKDCIQVNDINVKMFGQDVMIEGYLSKF